jgi:hypothetical protein
VSADDDVDGGLSVRAKTELAHFDLEARPSSAGNTVRSSKPGGHRSFVPGIRRAQHFDIVGELGLVAQWAVENRTDVLRPGEIVQHPMCGTERGVMANVLTMKAVELCHPIAGVVLHESDDRPVHACNVEAHPPRETRSVPDPGHGIAHFG